VKPARLTGQVGAEPGVTSTPTESLRRLLLNLHNTTQQQGGAKVGVTSQRRMRPRFDSWSVGDEPVGGVVVTRIRHLNRFFSPCWHVRWWSIRALSRSPPPPDPQLQSSGAPPGVTSSAEPGIRRRLGFKSPSPQAPILTAHGVSGDTGGSSPPAPTVEGRAPMAGRDRKKCTFLECQWPC
jgi:hypothetical protein